MKSPVWTHTPMGVRIAKATASAMEWLMWMNSTLNRPALTVSPASQVMSLTLSVRRCSSSLSLMSPADIRVA